MKHQVYRCCLPTLAGFTSIHCIGPGLQRRPAVCSPTSQPPRGIPPSCSGLLERGTATSPPSTTKHVKKLEPMVGIVPSILGFINVLTPYTQQLGCDSSTIRNHSSSTPLYSFTGNFTGTRVRDRRAICPAQSRLPPNGRKSHVIAFACRICPAGGRWSAKRTGQHVDVGGFILKRFGDVGKVK